MAVALGVGFEEVARLDGRSFSALEQALDRRWSQSHELLAGLCELVHLLVRVQVARGGARPPAPLRIERPKRPAAQPARSTGADLARALGRSSG